MRLYAAAAVLMFLRLEAGGYCAPAVIPEGAAQQWRSIDQAFLGPDGVRFAYVLSGEAAGRRDERTVELKIRNLRSGGGEERVRILPLDDGSFIRRSHSGTYLAYRPATEEATNSAPIIEIFDLARGGRHTFGGVDQVSFFGGD